MQRKRSLLEKVRESKQVAAMRVLQRAVERETSLELAVLSKLGIYYVRNKGKSMRYTRNCKKAGSTPVIRFRQLNLERFVSVNCSNFQVHYFF
ncbi:50S ribosomal protein L22 [Bienertia sinuspersici]